MDMMVAVKSCLEQDLAGYHEPIITTWGKQLPRGVSLEFFTGGAKFQTRFCADAWAINSLVCPDDYDGLPQKTRAILRYFLGNNYERILLVDTDTYVDHRLFNWSLDEGDYVGKIDRPVGETFPYMSVKRDGGREYHPEVYPWASGGFGYILSRKAAEIVVATEPMSWAEDFYVGQALGPYSKAGEIKVFDIGTFLRDHFPQITYKRGYHPSTRWMEETHARILKESENS